MGITEIMRLPHVLGSTHVVLVKVTKHRRRIDLTPCVVGESVSIRNLANGVNRGLAQLPARSAISSVMPNKECACSSSRPW